MRTPEGYEKNDIDKYLEKLKPDLYFLKPATYGFGESGHSDRVGCYKSKFWSVEVKREGKEPTPLQWQRIREVEAAGGKAFWGTAEKVIGEFETWIEKLR